MLTSDDFADMAEHEDSVFIFPFVSAVTDDMAPVSEGVAFSCSYRIGYGYHSAGLYYTSGEDASLISKNADAFCTDGEQVYYYDTEQKQVFSFDGEQAEAYFDIPLIDDSPYYVDRMLANEDWILLVSSGEIYQYNRKTAEMSFHQTDSMNSLGNYPPVLYDDKLVLFSGIRNRLTTFDLVTGEEKNWDFYVEPYTMSLNLKISSALHGNYIYLSIYNLLDSWGKPFECTVKIHRQTDEMVVIDDEYYENLLCTDTALYGGKIHRMTKICEFE